MQKGALKYVNLIKKYANLINGIEGDVAFRNCMLFGLKPKRKHIEIFREFSARDMGQTQHFVSNDYKGFHGKNSIIRGFWNSTWKSGYMKAVFKIPLPYYKVYVYLRKRKE